ncbi:hypothetical protein T484DRAFT_1880109, partial [Baffinella frigidus]
SSLPLLSSPFCALFARASCQCIAGGFVSCFSEAHVHITCAGACCVHVEEPVDPRLLSSVNAVPRGFGEAWEQTLVWFLTRIRFGRCSPSSRTPNSSLKTSAS